MTLFQKSGFRFRVSGDECQVSGIGRGDRLVALLRIYPG